MHHNVDKSLLVAGVTETRFGGGKQVLRYEFESLGGDDLGSRFVCRV